MSLSYLNSRVRDCNREMDKQRRGALRLLKQSKSDLHPLLQQEGPFAAAIALALISGFVCQRYLHWQTTIHLLRLVQLYRLQQIP